MIPLLLKPKLLSLQNRWKGARGFKFSFLRDLVLLVFGLVVMFGIYQFTYLGLIKAQEDVHIAYLSPLIPLSIIFLALMVMLLVSGTVTALGTLYLGQDLDLLLSAPLSPFRFFWGKLAYVIYSASWMPFLFLLPFIVAYGRVYDAAVEYYFITILVLIPYFVIPGALAIIIATLFATIVPAKRTRELLLLITLLFLVFVYLVSELTGWSISNRDNIVEIMRILSVMSLPDVLWLPSRWVAITIREYLENSGRSIFYSVFILYTFMLCILSVAFLLLSFLHSYAYSKANNNLQTTRASRFRIDLIEKILCFLKPSYKAIVIKEFKIFCREMTQAVQLFLLIGVYLIYLYNLRILRSLEYLPEETKNLWMSYFFIMNVSMGAFIAIAVCTRFTFPSISLEGRSFWILRSSPVDLLGVMNAKFWCWYLPVGFVSSIVFAAGIAAVQAGLWAVVINYIAGWVLSFGIVGIAIGFGAIFADFRWEHPSQLAASFGSLVFMLVSTIFITLNMLPVCMVIFVDAPRIPNKTMAQIGWGATILLCALVIVFVNVYAKRKALEAGQRALLKSLD